MTTGGNSLNFSGKSNVAALGVGAVVVLAVVGGVAVGSATTAGGPTGEADGNAVGAQDGSKPAVSINQTVQAMEVAQNRTNGTVVGTQLKKEGNTALDEGNLVYEVDVLQADGTHLSVDVDAANGTVIGVESEGKSKEFFESVFGNQDEVPDESLDVSTLRPATDAVQIAVNNTQSDEPTGRRTVTEVELEFQNDTLVYEVELEDVDGERRDVVVHAKKGQGGVITTEPQEGNDRD